MKSIMVLCTCLTVLLMSGCVATTAQGKKEIKDFNISYTLDKPIVYVVPKNLNMSAKDIIASISRRSNVSTSDGWIETTVENITYNNFVLIRRLNHSNRNLGIIERSRAVHTVNYFSEERGDDIVVTLNPISLYKSQIALIGSWKTYELSKNALFDVLSTLSIHKELEFKSEYPCASLQSNFYRMSKKKRGDDWLYITEEGFTFRCFPEFFPYRDGSLAKVKTQCYCTPIEGSNIVYVGDFLSKVETSLKHVVNN